MWLSCLSFVLAFFGSLLRSETWFFLRGIAKAYTVGVARAVLSWPNVMEGC